jgi:hypothetical protein
VRKRTETAANRFICRVAPRLQSVLSYILKVVFCMQHIDVLRLLDLAREAIITDAEESSHLKECEECQALLGVFTRQQRPPHPPQKKQAGGKSFKESA